MVVNLWMVQRAASRIFSSADLTPTNSLGLLLGADPILPDGTTNVHFFNRTQAAAELVFKARVSRLLVSGHPDNRGYNEARGMLTELIRLGVPADRIELDEAGNRTWHSFLNARNRWNLSQCTVITDSFHGPRALFLADRAGIQAVAYCRPDHTVNHWTIRSRVREWLARVWALKDIKRPAGEVAN